MKIRVIAPILFFLSLCLVTAFAFSNWHLQKKYDEKNYKRSLANRISNEVSNLRGLTTEYLLNPLERTKFQWHATNINATQLLDEITSCDNTTEGNTILNKFKEKNKKISDAFLQIELINTTEIPTSSLTLVSKQKQALTKFILEETGDMNDLAYKFRELTIAEMTGHYTLSNQFGSLFSLLSFLIIAISAGYFIWKVIVPINSLLKATETIAGGNLNYKVNITSHDEIGLLSDSFNKMAEKLKESHERLEEKVKARTRQLQLSETTLRESNAYLDSLINYANAPILVWNPLFKITRFNQAFERLTGKTADDTIGKHISILFPLEKAEESMGRIREAQQGKRWQVEEIDILHVDGSIRTVLWNSATIFDAENKTAISTIAQGQDITERKLAEKKLQKSMEQLKELDILKDNFLNTTTHELKTPLIPIKSQAELLLAGDYGALNKEQKEAVEMIFKNEEQLNILTGDVLDISKIKSNKMKLTLEETALGAIVIEAVRNFETVAEKKQIHLVIQMIPEIPKIFIDRRRITQVLSNLINNALKFTEKKGSIEISIAITDKNAIVSVKDSGIGMSKETLNKIFTPFFQAENNLTRKHGGTGLGLAICRGIIIAHNGKIWAESSGLNQGSTFYFSLPIK